MDNAERGEHRTQDVPTQGVQRGALACTNLAHAVAAFAPGDKLVLRAQQQPNLAIVSAYNDMLSAHQPLRCFPQIIKDAVRAAGGHQHTVFPTSYAELLRLTGGEPVEVSRLPSTSRPGPVRWTAVPVLTGSMSQRAGCGA